MKTYITHMLYSLAFFLGLASLCFALNAALQRSEAMAAAAGVCGGYGLFCAVTAAFFEGRFDRL